MNKSKSSIRRRGHGPAKVSGLLTSVSPQIGMLQQQAGVNAVIKAGLWPAIPTSLHNHCDVANFRGHTLVLIASSPVWAARLRHMSPQILHAARTLCKIDAQSLKIKIQPLEHFQPQKQRPRRLAADSAAHLKEIAEGLEDEELKETLLNIAVRGE